MATDMRIHIHICVDIHMNTHTQTHMHVHMRMEIHMRIYINMAGRKKIIDTPMHINTHVSTIQKQSHNHAHEKI